LGNMADAKWLYLSRPCQTSQSGPHFPAKLSLT
jgi:hypothetical protein